MSDLVTPMATEQLKDEIKDEANGKDGSADAAPLVSKGKQEDHGENPSLKLLTASKREQFALVAEILSTSHVLNLDLTDEVGKTVLHYLSNFARSEEILLCLNRACDINKVDKLGWTALHYAALKGHASVARILINFGADCNASDKQQGRTPLHYAVSRDNKDAVDLLLESGADPSIKDQNAQQPSDMSKNEIMKSTLQAAVEKFQVSHAGGTSETQDLVMDKPTAFPNLGLTIDPRKSTSTSVADSNTENACKISMRRTPAGKSKIDFGISETDEICSDVFTYKFVGKAPACLTMKINVPVTDGPEKNEELVMMTDILQEICVDGVKEENEKWHCSASADLSTFHSFVILCRPKQERFHVGQKACKLTSSLDDRVEMNIPKGTFDSAVTITMEITEPPKSDQLVKVMKECTELNGISSFYSLESGGSDLLKPIKVKVPLPTNYQGTGKLIIVSMDDNSENEKPESWKVISLDPVVKNDRVEFDVGSFSIKCATETSFILDDNKSLDLERTASFTSQVSRVFRKARRKEHSVRFSCFTRRLGTTNTFKVVVECCKENQLNERSAYWEAEGFEKQGEDNSTLVTVRAKETFKINVKSMKLQGNETNILLQFHPKLENLQTCVTKIPDDKQTTTGCVEVWNTVCKHIGDNENIAADNEPPKVAVINVKLLKFHPDMIDQMGDRSFLSYKRMLQLQEATEDRWWKVLLLMGVPFHKMDETLNETTGNTEQKINSMLFDWREKRRSEKSRGLPLILSALCRSGLRGVVTDIQINLLQWKEDPANRRNDFYEWLLMAYKYDLLVPTVYEKPMSDGFLAMLADQVDPSQQFASALNLTEGLAKDVFAKDSVYPVQRLKTMKILDMFRRGMVNTQNALMGIARALHKTNMKGQLRYLTMSTSTWLKKASIDNPMVSDTEQFLQQVAADSDMKV